MFLLQILQSNFVWKQDAINVAEPPTAIFYLFKNLNIQMFGNEKKMTGIFVINIDTI